MHHDSRIERRSDDQPDIQDVLSSFGVEYNDTPMSKGSRLYQDSAGANISSLYDSSNLQEALRALAAFPKQKVKNGSRPPRI